MKKLLVQQMVIRLHGIFPSLHAISRSLWSLRMETTSGLVIDKTEMFFLSFASFEINVVHMKAALLLQRYAGAILKSLQRY